MIGQAFITLLLVVAGLATLLSAAMLGMFTSRVPGGSDAMGLIVPLGVAALAGVAGWIATLCVAGRGGFDGVPGLRVQPMAAAVVAGLAVGLAIFGAFLGWADKHALAHPALLTISGLVLPLGYFAWLFMLTWRPDEGASSPGGRGMMVWALLAVVAGLITTALCLQAWWVQAARDRVQIQAQERVEQIEADRREALGEEGRLREDLAKFGPNAPLWTLVAGLPTEPNAALRAIWVERALQVPDFEAALQDTWTDEHGVYRHGCAALIVEMPASGLRPQAWAPWLIKDVQLTAGDIRRFGGLGQPRYDDLGQHVRTLTRASARLGLHARARSAFEGLRQAVLATPAGPARDDALKALESVLSPAP